MPRSGSNGNFSVVPIIRPFLLHVSKAAASHAQPLFMKKAAAKPDGGSFRSFQSFYGPIGDVLSIVDAVKMNLLHTLV